MRRRDFICSLAGSAAVWPFASRAQQPPVPVIAFLGITRANTYAPYVAAFRAGLQEVGYVEGQNVALEFRWADDQYDRLRALASELVRGPVNVMVTSGGTAVAFAARAASETIPLVFVSGSDPVKDGLVASLSRPGGNTTGVSLITNSLMAKRIELLRELMPKATTVATLANPTGPNFQADVSDAQEAARATGFRLLVLKASSEGEFEEVFATLGRAHAEGLVVEASAVFTSRRAELIKLAKHYAIPTIYEWRDFVVDGGLMSYGSSLADGYHQAGIYAGRILKGEKPRNLPVVQSTKVELVVNVETARVLGLNVPQSILARDDEVIE